MIANHARRLIPTFSAHVQGRVGGALSSSALPVPTNHNHLTYPPLNSSMRPVRRDNRPGRARCCILEFLWLSSVSWPTTTSHSNSVGECQAARGRPMRPQMCSNETRNVVLFIARHVPARGYVTSSCPERSIIIPRARGRGVHLATHRARVWGRRKDEHVLSAWTHTHTHAHRLR